VLSVGLLDCTPIGCVGQLAKLAIGLDVLISACPDEDDDSCRIGLIQAGP
jgi:hypothetical protein